ncbi:hypothetical protein Tco_0027226 [Tanacetum coccineum]
MRRTILYANMTQWAVATVAAAKDVTTYVSIRPVNLPQFPVTSLGRELSQEINNHSVPTLISQAPGPSLKRSRSPSSPFYPDATIFSNAKLASETSELNPEDVTAKIEDIKIRADDAENRRAEDHEQIQIILAR